MPRRRQPRAVATFASLHEALACERCCQEAGIAGRLIPTPVQITADCGLAWSMPPEERAAFCEVARETFAYEDIVELVL